MRFKQCAAGTVGVEWELQIVDPETRDLVGRAPELIARIRDSRVTGEFFTNTIELVSRVHPGADSALREMRELRDIAVEHAASLGLALVGMGVHPFADWRAQRLADSDRYRRVVDTVGTWGRQQIMIGVHTHFGVGDGDLAIRLQRELLADLPLILAVSASSPFWQGQDSGVDSQRTMIFQQLPNAGLPPSLASWQEYTELVGQMRRAEVVREADEIRWTIRPSPGYGTMEVRVADGAATIDDLAATNALTVLLAERGLRRLRAGAGARMPAEWILRENRWRATRFGLRAQLIDADGAQRPLRDALAETILELEPLAQETGAEDGHRALRALAERGSSAERQRRVDAVGSAAVVDHLIDQLRA